MLNAGDADCILVTQWQNDVSTRILIDGGNTDTARKLKQFLQNQGIYCIDHVVSTHPHDDHAAGLVEFLKDEEFFIGTAWVHRPELHADLLKLEMVLNRSRGLKRVKAIQETLATAESLIGVCAKRKISIKEPFAGKQLGYLTVVGPTERYYTELLAQFADASQLQASDKVLNECELQEWADAILEAKGVGGSDVLLDNPQTQPENNSSVVLATLQEDGKYLFTADAGAQALALAAQVYELSKCRWMQIPHHGSRRNITKSLIQVFSPTSAFVSASGSEKHPRRAVINAFKETGTRVLSTHYPWAGDLWHHRGEVPPRAGYSSCPPLWEAKQ